MTLLDEQLSVLRAADPTLEDSAEAPEAVYRHGHYMQTLGKLAVGAVIVVGGAGVGGYHGAQVAAKSPTHTEIIPGLSTDIVLQKGSSGSVLSTSIGNVSLPALHEQVPHVGEVGIKATLNTVLFSGNTAGAAATVINNPEQIVKKPVKDALVKHIKAGAEKGILEGSAEGMILAAGSWLALAEYQHKQRKSELSKQQPQAHSRSKLWGAAVLGLAVATIASTESNIASYHKVQPIQEMTAIDPSLTADIPLLKGAMVTANSPLEFIINNALVGVLQTKAEIDNFYQKSVVPNIDNALAAWQADPANQVWLNNTNLVPTLFVAGEHCSVPYALWVAPAINTFLKPLVVVKTGDIMVNADISLFGHYCQDIGKYGIAAAVKATNQQVKVIVASGDHDPNNSIGADLRALSIVGPGGKSYRPYEVLDAASNYTAAAHGITVVGAPDPVQNIYGAVTEVNGKPAGDNDINDALVKASNLITKTACNVAAKGKIKPIIAAHVRELEYAVKESGCASGIFSGEGRGGLFSYDAPDSSQSVFAVEPSVSGIGDGNSFSPYEKIISDAPTIFALIDKQSSEITGLATLTIHPDGSVSITPIAPPPNNPYDPSVSLDYLKQFNPSALPATPLSRARGGLRLQ